MGEEARQARSESILPRSSGNVADACEMKLEELRRELSLLEAQYPELDWSPLAMLEASEAGLLDEPEQHASYGLKATPASSFAKNGAAGGADAKPRWDNIPSAGSVAAGADVGAKPRWDYMPPPRNMVRRVPPGYRPLGYRVRHTSAPAFTMSPRIVLSRNVDPYLADDNPGPGAYDIGQWIH